MSRRAIALGLCLLPLAACAPTVVSVQSYRAHRPLDESVLTTLSELADTGDLTKARVLTELGPPVGVIGQGGGEIFVYRHVARDTSIINLDPGYLVPGAPSIPLYVDRDVSGRDDVLMVFFDAQGRVVGSGIRHYVNEVTGSRAASAGQLLQGWLE
jgi:hypothetical protein